MHQIEKLIQDVESADSAIRQAKYAREDAISDLRGLAIRDHRYHHALKVDVKAMLLARQEIAKLDGE